MEAVVHQYSMYDSIKCPENTDCIKLCNKDVYNKDMNAYLSKLSDTQLY